MERVEVLQELEPGYPELAGLICVREWLVRLTVDIASVLEAIAAHDNRLDV